MAENRVYHFKYYMILKEGGAGNDFSQNKHPLLKAEFCMVSDWSMFQVQGYPQNYKISLSENLNCLFPYIYDVHSAFREAATSS